MHSLYCIWIFWSDAIEIITVAEPTVVKESFLVTESDAVLRSCKYGGVSNCKYCSCWPATFSGYFILNLYIIVFFYMFSSFLQG